MNVYIEQITEVRIGAWFSPPEKLSRRDKETKLHIGITFFLCSPPTQWLLPLTGFSSSLSLSLSHEIQFNFVNFLVWSSSALGWKHSSFFVQSNNGFNVASPPFKPKPPRSSNFSLYCSAASSSSGTFHFSLPFYFLNSFQELGIFFFCQFSSILT